jgi:hypothetical protein
VLLGTMVRASAPGMQPQPDPQTLHNRRTESPSPRLSGLPYDAPVLVLSRADVERLLDVDAMLDARI